MKQFITVLGAGFLVLVPPAESQLSSSAGVITSTSVGPVRLGMTVAQARNALPGTTFVRTTGGDGEALIAVKRGENLLMTLYTGDAKPAAPIDERAVIEFVEARDAGYRTSAGVNPTMPLREAARKYGRLDEISLSEIEAREYATFANHPIGISFRVRTDSVLAGVYPANQAKTERYVPSAYVFGISISGRRKRAPTFASAYTDVKAQCVNPAPANNEAQHSSLHCKGPGNYRIHIFDSAEALEITAQTLDGQSSTRLASQSLTWDQQPRKIEWRLADGKPFAVILRVFKYSGKGQYPLQEKPIGEVLLVKGLPGYEHIDAEVDVTTTKNANEKARRLADGNYDKVSAYLQRGYASLARNDAVTAIAEATKAIAADSQNAAAYLLRGSAYSTKGAALDSALSDLDQAIKLNPDFAPAYFSRGLVRQRARTAGPEYAALPAAALTDFSEAVRLRPEWAQAYFRRGLLYQERGEHQQAIGDLTKAIALKFDPAMSYRARGEAFAAQKQYEAAIADFSKVISLEPKNPYVHKNRAAAYCAAGRKDLAAADEKRVVELGVQLFEDERCGAGTASERPPEQASVENPLPRFEDYPALEKLTGEPVNPIISSPRARLYRTSIRNDVKAGPNFAGRYTVASWGCSSTCVGFAVVDARSGNVVFHPKVLQIAQVPYQTENVIQFRPDSRLLIIAGEILPLEPDEATAPDGVGKFYYEWTGNRFTLIRTASIQRERGAP
jgi:tetratricopeptide (TPR) repeat protein